MHTTNKSVSAR